MTEVRLCRLSRSFRSYLPHLDSDLPAFDVELKIYPLEPQSPAAPPAGFRSHSPVLPSVPLPEHPPFIPRPSHSRKRKEGHIPRPPNAFMLFRSDLWAKKRVSSNVERDHRQISRIAAMLWNGLDEEQRRPFREQAKAEKERHALTWPNYKYSPVGRKVNGQRKYINREADSTAQAKCQKLVSLLKKGIEGSDLENALKTEGDVSEEKFDPKAIETIPHPSVSSSVPTISVSQSVRHSLLGSSKLPTLEVKREPTRSPELVFDDPPFVPTEDIPHIELPPPSIKEEVS
jgi:hypothetical protein